MIKILSIFFKSKKNSISLLIAVVMITLLYVLYLETSQSQTIQKHFFGAGFVTIPSLIFFLYYFNVLFSNSYFRFLHINISRKAFFSFIFYLILSLSIIVTTAIIAIYFILNTIYFNGVEANMILFKNISYLLILNVFLCCLSFVINSVTTSLWVLFFTIFYFLFEDLLALLLENNNFGVLVNALPQRNALRVFSSPNPEYFYLLPFVYIAFLVLFIRFKNYRLL